MAITELYQTQKNPGMKLIMAIILTLVGLACHPKDSMPPAIRRDRLVSADEKEKTSAEELRARYGQLAQYVKNGFTAYRITYMSTNREGKEFLSSGALFVPDTNMALPVFNYNHGTYFPSQEREAPSYLGNSYELIMGKLFAGAGYLVVMPDYPGYGESRDMEHPYGAYHEIAGSVIDMLFAVKEFCSKQDIHLSGKNFFCGWSEGAAVALATVKALEEGNIKLVLPWVQKDDEPEITHAFLQTLAVRKLSSDAKELADRFFFETVVRVHRAGEGAPFTGLKPPGTGVTPAIAGADKALISGDVSPLVLEINKQVNDGIRARFKNTAMKKSFAPGDVPAGRAYVQAYVDYVHYVEAIHEAAVKTFEHHARTGAASQGETEDHQPLQKSAHQH